MNLPTVIAGFGVGIALGTYRELGFEYGLFAAVLSVALFSYLRFAERLGLGSKLYLAPLVLLALSIGLLRVDLARPGESALSPRVGHEVELEGVVVREPDVRESRTRLVVEVDRLDGTDIAPEKVLASVPLLLEFEYGDRVGIAGKLAVPENFETDNGRTFNYRKFLEKDGVRFEAVYAEASVLGKGEGSVVMQALFSAKRVFIEGIGRAVPEPESSLLSGILIGGKSSLGESIQSDFRDSGLAHIVVLSGYNLAIVAVVLMWAFSFLPRRLGIVAAAVGIMLFVLMSGGGASAARAGLMAMLVLAARLFARRYDALRGLLIAGLLMALHNPLILLYDPSFELSFMATLSLILVSPLVEPRLSLVTARWHLREIVTATVATQAFMLPLILYLMGNVSLVALPVNVLVLPAIPAAMLFGFITGAVALASPALALVPGFIAHLILAFVLQTARIAASVPHASVSVRAFPLSVLAISYAVYAFVIWKLRRGTLGKPGGEQKGFDTSMAFEIIN